MAADAPLGRRPRPRPLARPGLAALAGVAAAAAALGAGELVIGVAGKDDPSLVSAVGSEFIDRFGAQLKDQAIAWFGHNDKRALLIGIVVVALGFGALVGLLARIRFAYGAAALAGFGLLGVAAYQAGELGSTATGVVASAVAVAAGVSILHWLVRAAVRVSGVRAPRAGRVGPDPRVDDGVRRDGRLEAAPRSPIDPRRMARRAFLGTVAAVGAGAGALALVGRRLAGRGASEAARAEVVLPDSTVAATTVRQPFAIEGLTPFVVPNDRFYRIDTALTLPQVHLESWRLSLKGMVDHPFELTYDELLAMDSVAETVTISCVSNEVGGDLVGNAVWQGVPLGVLLDRAGVQEGAGQVVGRSIDGFTAGFPFDAATDGRTALVAYAMNGEPLPVRHGFPARLIVAGLYGYVSATKWLDSIELTTWDAVDGYWIPRGWSKEAPVKTQSRIDVPRPGGGLTAGTVPVAGVAWAPDRGIAKVEVQVDDGPWQVCELGRVTSVDTWVQWLLRWDATPGEHVLTVRATDARGDTQTSDIARPDPNGATGWHSRRVKVT